MNTTKEPFANSPGLAGELMNAIMDALAAHTNMSKQALDAERVRAGIRGTLLGSERLWEDLRAGRGRRREARQNMQIIARIEIGTHNVIARPTNPMTGRQAAGAVMASSPS